MSCGSLRTIFVSILLLGLTISSASATLIDGLSFEHYSRLYSTGIVVGYGSDAESDEVGSFIASEKKSDSSYEISSNFKLEIEIENAISQDTGEYFVADYSPVYVVPAEDLFYSTITTDFGLGGDDQLESLLVQDETVGGMASDGESIGITISGVSISPKLLVAIN
ncbi:MAG: hypothetical protein KAR11_00930 [Phycisphaerae bacterium]|nr:hypothetical protein [Phycisphaerae bacterium]